MHIPIRFQSTLPKRRETLTDYEDSEAASISIHSPQTERDIKIENWGKYASNFNPLSPNGERRGHTVKYSVQENFNPLSPNGERLLNIQQLRNMKLFQSTLPKRRETYRCLNCVCYFSISIHSPQTERDFRLTNTKSN